MSRDVHQVEFGDHLPLLHELALKDQQDQHFENLDEAVERELDRPQRPRYRG